MWRESFEHGVGIVDPHPLDEQRTTALFANYGITDRLTAIAMLPYLWTGASQGGNAIRKLAISPGELPSRSLYGNRLIRL